MRPAAVPLLLGVVFAAAPAFADPPPAHGDAAPLGLTASLEGVPTFDPVSVQAPYALDWERRLQAFQLTFERKLVARAAAADIDPIETGSISAAR